jgi:translocation and assembly module TamB
MRFLRSRRPAGSSDEPRRRGRWSRWLLRSCVAGIGLVALVALVVLVLLHSLDRPWLKRRLQALALASAGVEIDYRAARVKWLSGAEIEGLVVQSPAEVRRFAPDLVRVGRAEARWSLGALLSGRGPVVRRVALSDVTLTAVVDEHGRTSFDALTPSGSTSAPGPTVPLSRQASKLLGTVPPVEQLDLDHVVLALVRTRRAIASTSCARTRPRARWPRT